MYGEAGLAQATPAYILRKKNARLLKVISVTPWQYELEEKLFFFFKAKSVFSLILINFHLSFLIRKVLADLLGPVQFGRSLT